MATTKREQEEDLVWTVPLLKSTSMKEVIRLGKDPEYNGEGLQEHEFLVSVTVAVSFIFAKAVTRS